MHMFFRYTDKKCSSINLSSNIFRYFTFTENCFLKFLVYNMNFHLPIYYVVSHEIALFVNRKKNNIFSNFYSKYDSLP